MSFTFHRGIRPRRLVISSPSLLLQQKKHKDIQSPPKKSRWTALSGSDEKLVIIGFHYK
jgi:hypothetical protein